MQFEETPLKGAYIIKLEPFADDRGLFARTFCKREFQSIGHEKEFVQFNFSKTSKRGSIRGMHYQVAPSAEIKLIRCIRGAVYDVIVDLRDYSPTFLKSYGVELSEDNLSMLYIPEGFAHGFQTMEDNCQLIYHHTEYYKPECERGLRYNDPELAIAWPIEVTVISDKDKKYETIKRLEDLKIRKLEINP